MPSFSVEDRQEHLRMCTAEPWDVAIIGGGITGAGILLDVVSRGLRAVLIEKSDFASGTSGRSTKLIHGGLRYLKNLELGLVREVGTERAIVHQNARHLVRPEPMLLPIHAHGSLGRISSALGLWVYELLAGVHKGEQRKMLSRAEALGQEPLLRDLSLRGAGLYYEYRTDDARLTLAILRKAVAMGALAVNYCEATAFPEMDGKVCGVHCTDVLNNTTLTINARCVINASGPWVDSVLQLCRSNHPAPSKHLLLTKGVHIVVSRARLPLHQSVYFDVPGDNRMIFCIPRDEVVYIGTTDTIYNGDPDVPAVLPEDRQYLLHAVNQVLDIPALTEKEITGEWAGLRPLIFAEGKPPAALSRRDEIFVSPQGLVSIAGGKLTGYRRMAQRITDLVIRSHFPDKRNTVCTTAYIRLAAGDFASDEEMQAVRVELHREFPQYPAAQIDRLFFRYGDEARHILSTAQEIDLPSDQAVLHAEVAHVIAHEMCHTAEDFILRRTGMTYFEPAHADKYRDEIVRLFARSGR